MSRIDIEIDDTAVQAALTRLARAGQDMTPAMERIAGTLLDVIGRAFDSESDPATGAAWPDLKPRTIARRQKAGHWPGKKLQRSGQLLASMQSEYGPDYAVAGTNKVYAAHHHFGSKPEWRHNIPARPFLGLSPADNRQIVNVIADYITDAFV